jgi:hypothetical protein
MPHAESGSTWLLAVMGHMVHRDRPQLVVELVQHVLENLPGR